MKARHEQLQIHYESEKRRADDRSEENAEQREEIERLKAMVNELREAMKTVERILYDDCFVAKMPAKHFIELVLEKHHAQSLHDRDMRIAEAVRDECIRKLDSVMVKSSITIRNIDLKPIVEGIK